MPQMMSRIVIMIATARFEDVLIPRKTFFPAEELPVASINRRRTIGPSILPALLLICANSAGQDRRLVGKFTPAKGKTMVAVGSSWEDGISPYTKATGHKPQGIKYFSGFDKGGAVAYFNHQVRNQAAEGGLLVIEFALDKAFPKESAKDADKLGPFLRGEMDEGIEEMGRAIRDSGRHVFVALGYEFDGQHPHQAREYAATYRRIHDAWDRLGVKNVAYVWHTYTDNFSSPDPKVNKTQAQLYEYYPGDQYVDWFGVSVYYETQRQGAVRFARMARDKGKPLAIIESGVGVNPHKFWDYSWSGCYVPLFRTVEQLDVGLRCYNNFGDDFNQFSPPGDPFRNTRMDRMPREIREGWAKMMRTARYRQSIGGKESDPDDRRVDGVAKSAKQPGSGRAKDLPGGIDLGRDAIKGDWNLSDKTLVYAGDREFAQLLLRGEPPEEYDLTVVAERVSGTEILVIGLVVGGSRTILLLDGWGGGVSGLEFVDGKASGANVTTHRGWRFVNGRRATITCRVRKGGVTVICDGKRIVDWKGDPGRLSLNEGWAAGGENLLFLGGWKGGSYRIHRVDIQPVGRP